MKICAMTVDSVSQVADLEKEYFSVPWSEESLRQELDNPLSLWLTAVEDGTVIGYIGAQTVLGEADMMNLAVKPDFRRCGIGERLVSELIERLKEIGANCLLLEVRSSNQSAIALYEKMGFSQVGRRKNYYVRPREDALILRKEWGI